LQPKMYSYFRLLTLYYNTAITSQVWIRFVSSHLLGVSLWRDIAGCVRCAVFLFSFTPWDSLSISGNDNHFLHITICCAAMYVPRS
jgi:hypothetical protein